MRGMPAAHCTQPVSEYQTIHMYLKISGACDLSVIGSMFGQFSMRILIECCPTRAELACLIPAQCCMGLTQEVWTENGSGLQIRRCSAAGVQARG